MQPVFCYDSITAFDGVTCNDDEIPACAGMTVNDWVSVFAGDDMQ